MIESFSKSSDSECAKNKPRRGLGLTSYQLPVTFYQLPSTPIDFFLSVTSLADFRAGEIEGERSVGDGDQPFHIVSICIQSRTGPGVRSRSLTPHRFALKEEIKRLDFVNLSGYIYSMKDRDRDKDSMVHVRFTEDERRQLKAHCALLGISMQEYIREATLKGLVRKRGGLKK